MNRVLPGHIIFAYSLPSRVSVFLAVQASLPSLTVDPSEECAALPQGPAACTRRLAVWCEMRTLKHFNYEDAQDVPVMMGTVTMMVRQRRACNDSR
jgi:hypothetical protein